MPDIFIFVNLKRFEVPKKLGGLCSMDDPVAWIESVMEETVQAGLGSLVGLHLTFLLPEGLIDAAVKKIKTFPKAKTATIRIGCQGVHWDDITPRGNSGAFTTSLPAAAAKSLGSTWAIIGHSEERKAKLQIIQAFEPAIDRDEKSRSRAVAAVDHLIRAEVQCALRADLDVLLCVGETAEERGSGSFEEQKSRIQAVLKSQLSANLAAVGEFLADRQIVVGYEPVWAIGPGKTPPGKDHISFVSAYIKQVVLDNIGFDPLVVYGGGLKEENAGMISTIEAIDGGLVGLTRFTGDIGFDVKGLKRIIVQYESES